MGLPLRKLFHRPHHEIRLAALLADRPLCAVDQWRSNPISDMTAPAPRVTRAFPTEVSWSVNAECAELGIVLVRRNLPGPLSARLHLLPTQLAVARSSARIGSQAAASWSRPQSSARRRALSRLR